MELRLRVFIDFWNFQLNWNDRTNKTPIAWPKVPIEFANRTRSFLASTGSTDSVTLDETRVYTSIDRSNSNEAKLRGWLDSYLDRQPSFRVFTRERKSQHRPIRCSSCGAEVVECPQCHQPYRKAPEKGVDAAIVTDLLSLAWEAAYNIAVLVSSDADFIPAVEKLQEKGFKVINATWQGHGHQLAKVCWASFEINQLIDELRRS